ncbi:MAG TPA: hypothetical protein VMA09_07425 [Candidatus Binataceae bacterium]|nr:hypothetical protein [Candidatus Binataceae bacterium]
MPDSEARRDIAAIDHQQFVDRYLSEVESEERREAQRHVAGCAECQEKLAAETAMKAEMQTLTAVRAPLELRDRILAALDEVDRESERAAAQRSRSLGRTFSWIAAGAIAACLVAVVFLRASFQTNPAFDSAIATFEKSQQNFAPNIPSDSAAELAASFITQFGVPMAWDFSSLGLSVAGGRIDHAPDGRVVGYSMYKGNRGTLMCIIYRADAIAFPPGGQLVKGIHIYEYKGYSIAETNRYAVFAIMVSTVPAADLQQAFAQLPG